jgi:nucleotide-binding universal stress UspA family protein
MAHATDRWSHPAVILVATDLSDIGRLMPYALEQGALTGAHLILLHVIATSESITADAAGLPYYDPGAALELAAKALDSCCAMARQRNVACDGLVREGNAAQQVLSAARQFKADRILLGTRSRGKVSKLLIGSVAEQVLRSANIPVITVGPEAHLHVESSEPERVVLHATTLRETSRPSAALACRIASTLDAKVVLLHVLPPQETERKGLPTGLHSAAIQEVRTLAAETSIESSVPVEPQVVLGNPSIEILAKAAELHASLIVLGATHRSVFENLTRDRTVYTVLAHARCPVMTLRELDSQKDENVIAGMAMHAQ